MMCGNAENLAEVMEGNGGSLPRWCEKAGSCRMGVTFWGLFRRGMLNLLESSWNRDEIMVLRDSKFAGVFQ